MMIEGPLYYDSDLILFGHVRRLPSEAEIVESLTHTDTPRGLFCRGRGRLFTPFGIPGAAPRFDKTPVQFRSQADPPVW